MSRTIPFKDFDFNVVQEAIATASIRQCDDWGLDANWMNGELLPAKNEWAAAWAAYENPMTRNKLIIFEKQEARTKYEKRLRILINILKSNTKVTDDDRKAMGLVFATPHRRSIPAPENYPEITIDNSIIRRIGVAFRDRESSRKAKPYGVHGAKIQWALLPAPPANVDDLLLSAFATHSPFTLEFKESQRGSTVYFCLCWENMRGVRGPWSEIVSAVIP
jgi:hypothetical protein